MRQEIVVLPAYKISIRTDHAADYMGGRFYPSTAKALATIQDWMSQSDRSISGVTEIEIRSYQIEIPTHALVGFLADGLLPKDVPDHFSAIPLGLGGEDFS